MKQYRIRLTILILLSYLILSGVLFISYYMITNNFLNNKASENIFLVSESVKTHIDLNLQDDYDKFVKFYNEYKDEIDPVREMMTNKDNISLQGINFSGFGYNEDGVFVINETDYIFKPELSDRTYYNMNVSVYPFSDILEGNVDDTNYLVFQYEGVIAYLDASLYFEAVFVLNNPLEYDYYIIHKDGYIFLAEDSNYSTLRFGEYILSESERNHFFDEIENENSGLILMKFKGIKSYLSFQNLSFGTNTDDVYVIQAFKYENVISDISQLSQSLLFTYIVASLIFISLLMLGYKFSEIKFTDIEDARIIHYYDKPYVLYVNKKGRILSSNKSFKNDIKEHRQLKSVHDFITTENINILEYIKKQKTVNVLMKNEEKERYIRFIPIKYMFKYALIGDDITNIEKKFANYKSIAYFNQITKLPNVYHSKFDLFELLEDEKALQKNVLAMLSIANFNNLTNLFGEKLLNDLLIEIKTLLLDLVEPYDAKLYNLYYDHFAILFTKDNVFEETNKIIIEIMNKLEKVFDFENNKLNLDFRIGVFNIDKIQFSDLTPDKIYNNATLALNKAKYLQSKKIVYYDITLGQKLSKRELMEEDLQTAIEKEEFMIYLQPQYSTTLNKIVSFEALVRWDNPKYIHESPQEFITLAESNNMIIDIGKIIIKKTMQVAKKLEDYNVKISINISPAQMMQAGFITDLVDEMEKYEVKKEMIALEVTETFSISNFNLIIEKLKQLRKLGIAIHLDDFGTGQSSMLYLKELPIDTIKIDKKFVDSLLSDKYSKAIINMIISLAKTLDLDVIAEGIETEKQYNALKKMGCGIIQGYYIGKGTDFDKALALLKKTNLNPEKKGD